MIDGNSSDLYLYDLQENTLRRLSDETLNIGEILWSPDGERILYTTVTPLSDYFGSSLYALEPANGIVNDPKPLYDGLFWMGWDWLSPELYLISSVGDGGKSNLQSINVETGEIKALWPYEYDGYARDPETNQMFVSGAVDDSDSGVYEVFLDGNYRKVAPEYLCLLMLRPNASTRFVGWDYDCEKAVGITEDGKVISLSQRGNPRISISPNGKWLVVYDQRGMDILDENDQIVRVIDDPVASVKWQPDSMVLFFASGKSIYRLSVPDGQPTLLDECSTQMCEYYSGQIVWLP